MEKNKLKDYFFDSVEQYEESKKYLFMILNVALISIVLSIITFMVL